MTKKLKVYGPVQDGMFSTWMVVGPRGGWVAEFYTKKDAKDFIKQQEELAFTTRR